MLDRLHKYHLRRKISHDLTQRHNSDDVTLVGQMTSHLKVNHLRSLVLSMKTKGGICACVNSKTLFVTLQKGKGRRRLDINFQRFHMCRLLRWTEMSGREKLVRIPDCRSTNCVNPYHFSRWIESEIDKKNTSVKREEDYEISPPAAIDANPRKFIQTADQNSKFQHQNNPDKTQHETKKEEVQKVPATQYSTIGSGGIKSLWKKFCLKNDSNDEFSNYSRTLESSESDMRLVNPAWCKLVYWEGRKRVGRQFPVVDNYVNIFTSLPRGQGFCLSDITSAGDLWEDERPPRSSHSVRKKIGHGVTVALCGHDDVVMYNRSQVNVFVQTPLDSSIGGKVCKLRPGTCMRVFRLNDCFSWYDDCDVTNDCSVRVSFVKGWGCPQYKRATILSCPCWLEILFVPDRSEDVS